MFLRASAEIFPRIHQISLGASCRYAIVADDGLLTLTDPGATSHIGALEQRLKRSGFSLSMVNKVLITHLDADRVAGIGLLRRLNPALQVFGSSAMHFALKNIEFVKEIWEQDAVISSWFPQDLGPGLLPFAEFRDALRIDKSLVESDTVTLGAEIALRTISTPGHRSHSLSYLVVPHEFLITDETFGYYNGRQLAAPGADDSLAASIESINKFKNLEISGIGFSYGGSITGALVRKHLDMILQNTQDLIDEVKKAKAAGVPDTEMRAQIREAFYAPMLHDPCLINSLDKSFEAVWRQSSTTS